MGDKVNTQTLEFVKEVRVELERKYAKLQERYRNDMMKFANDIITHPESLIFTSHNFVANDFSGVQRVVDELYITRRELEIYTHLENKMQKEDGN